MSGMKHLSLPTVARVLLLACAVAVMPTAGPLPAPSARADEPAAFAIPDSDDGLPGAGPIRRSDWFRKLWKERRGEWAGRKAADKRALVFLGDSITQGFGDDFQGAFPGAKLANRGISGDTTRGMLLRLAHDGRRGLLLRSVSCAFACRTLGFPYFLPCRNR